ALVPLGPRAVREGRSREHSFDGRQVTEEMRMELWHDAIAEVLARARGPAVHLAARLAGIVIVLLLPCSRSMPLVIRLLAGAVVITVAPFALAMDGAAASVSRIEIAMLAPEVIVGAALGLAVLVSVGVARATVGFILAQAGTSHSLLDRRDESGAGAGLATAILVFVLAASGAIRAFVSLVVSSFDWAPLGSVGLDAARGLARELAIETLPALLGGMIALALPTLAALALVTALEGVVARMLPRFDLLVLAAPVRALVEI